MLSEDGTNNGVRISRDAEEGVNRDFNEEAQERMILLRYRSVCAVIVFTLALFGIFAYTSIGRTWDITAGMTVFTGLTGMISGQIIGAINKHFYTKKMQRSLIEKEKQQRDEVSEILDNFVGVFTIDSIRNVSSRVAERILARHAIRLLESEYREATIEDTNRIISEEVERFRREAIIEME